jgi:hypothetical protein
MNKRAQLLLVAALLVVFSGAARVMADDLNPAPFRGLPGSTFSAWTYDDPPPFADTGDVEPEFPWDAPDSSSFVSGPPSFEDPETGGWFGNSSAEDEFALQVFAVSGWADSFMGRDGVLTDFVFGSWDIRNFFDFASQKDLRMQLTWKPMVEPGIGAENLVAFFEVEGLDGGLGDSEGTFGSFDLTPDGDTIILPDGWFHSTFDFSFFPNPSIEFIGIFPEPYLFTPPRGSEEEFEWTMAIDQVIFDTISFPEPATFALLAAGASMLLLRKRRS